jgi:hypothetical protein
MGDALQGLLKAALLGFGQQSMGVQMNGVWVWYHGDDL